MAQVSFDLLVFGATPGGLACAVRAAREGLSVLLVHHHAHLGGFLTSGAGGWEAPYDGFRCPLLAELRQGATAYYRAQYGEGSQQHLASLPKADSRKHIDRPKLEPRVAELLIERLVAAESLLTVWRGWFPVAVARQDRHLRSVTFQAMHGEERRTVAAQAFADGSYEGDLLAVAGTPYRVGREAREEYGEPHAGRIFVTERPHVRGQAGWPAVAAEGKLAMRHFGHASAPPMQPASDGAGDAAVMAYNYRLILTKDPANRVPAPQPANYDAARYPQVAFGSIVPNLPNDKIAWNAGRLIGPQHGYPEGDWATRERIARQYLDYILGQLWYLQHDPGVPAATRAFWADYGLARDEFPDNQHLPYEVYVREARRLLGRRVFTEHDGVPVPGLGRPPIQSDSVATTDWPLDSVACHEVTVPGSRHDGVFFLAEESRPAQVPWGSLLPRDLDNLVVPVCLASSHVGWGCLRLEPVWVQTGEAAGLAVALAARLGVPVGQLPPVRLEAALALRQHLITFLNDADSFLAEPWVAGVQFWGTQGFFSDFEARPLAPLTAPVAAIWLAIAGDLLQHGRVADTTAQARRVAMAEAQGGAASVSHAEWAAALAGLAGLAGLSQAPPAGPAARAAVPATTDASTPVARGPACQHLLAILHTQLQLAETAT